MACAHGQASTAHRDRYAVAPPVWVTEPPAAARSLTPEIQAGFEAEGMATDAITEGPSIACAEDAACLTQLGLAAGADTLVIARLARLGPTTLVRLQSVDVPGGAMEHTLQSVIEDTDDERLARSLRESSQRLARLYAPSTPWYRRPMVIAAGVVVAVAATVAVVMIARDGDAQPDVTVVPP